MGHLKATPSGAAAALKTLEWNIIVSVGGTDMDIALLTNIKDLLEQETLIG